MRSDRINLRRNTDRDYAAKLLQKAPPSFSLVVCWHNSSPSCDFESCPKYGSPDLPVLGSWPGDNQRHSIRHALVKWARALQVARPVGVFGFIGFFVFFEQQPCLIILLLHLRRARCGVEVAAVQDKNGDVAAACNPGARRPIFYRYEGAKN